MYICAIVLDFGRTYLNIEYFIQILYLLRKYSIGLLYFQSGLRPV